MKNLCTKALRSFLLALALAALISATSSAAQTRIDYLGGAVMRPPIDVYLIWYGQWGAITDPIPLLVTNFVADLGGSDYAHINDGYQGIAGINVFRIAGWAVDAYSQGTQIDERTVYNIVVANALLNNWPMSDNESAVFFVITSSDLDATNEGTLFGAPNGMCGWHGSIRFFKTRTSPSPNPKFNDVPLSPNLRFGFVGDPGRVDFASCVPQFSPFQANQFGSNMLVPPNDRSGDAITSHLAHELMEAANDPDHTAYQSSLFGESADYCRFNFGSILTRTYNGGNYNLRLPASSPPAYSHYYLVQQELTIAPEGIAYCAMTPLHRPNLVYPNDGAQNVATNFTVRWNDGLDGASPDPIPALIYGIYYQYWPYGGNEPINQPPYYTLVVDNQPCNADSTSVCGTFVQNMPDGNYRWYATANKNIPGFAVLHSPPSQIAFFTVGFQPISTIPKPLSPYLQYPFDGAQNVASNFPVQWTDGLDASNTRSWWPVTYAIYYKYWPYGGIEPASYTLVTDKQPCNRLAPGVCGTFVWNMLNGNYRWYVTANMDVSSSTGRPGDKLSADSSVAFFTVGLP